MSIRQSPFIVANAITNPSDFWGRAEIYNEIYSRLTKSGSCSIIGPRRIGKTSLLHYIFHKTQVNLRSTHQFVLLDAQKMRHSATVNHFFSTIAVQAKLPYKAGETPTDCLINFEVAIEDHPYNLVLLINEFENLTDIEKRPDFDESFYNSLRALADQGYLILITASCEPLKTLCEHVLGLSSPFYNIFLEFPLGIFTATEADGFLAHHLRLGALNTLQVNFIKTHIPDYTHPLKLQLACNTVFGEADPVAKATELLTKIKQTFAHFEHHISKLPPNPPADIPIALRNRHTEATVALKKASENQYQGTGFLIEHDEKIYVITCAHVVESCCQGEPVSLKGEIIFLDHFADGVDDLKAEVIWYKTPDKTAEYWSASEDVAILRLDGNIPPTVKPVSLTELNSVSQTHFNNCWTFGYPKTHKSHGAWLKGVTCGHKIAQGFVELVLTGKDVEKGMSGAMLCNQQGHALGIIQAKLGQTSAFLIPIEPIINIVNSLLV